MKNPFLLLLLALAGAVPMPAAGRHILLIAGTPSHGPLEHEQNAGVLLLAKLLNRVPGVQAATSTNGWPPDTSTFSRADAISIFCDGSSQHIAFRDDHPAAVGAAEARGAGLMFYHYAVEPPDSEIRARMLDWIGGYFELNYSVNPIWEADFQSLPRHPITRGVEPFRIRDEWYFNMRFRSPMDRITPILVAVPPASATNGPDGIRSGNPDVRSKAGRPACVAWAYERPNGGRSVGFTGGHYHLNLANGNFRKLVLNSILWTSKVEIPPNGIESTITGSDLRQNLDPKGPR